MSRTVLATVDSFFEEEMPLLSLWLLCDARCSVMCNAQCTERTYGAHCTYHVTVQTWRK